MGEMDSKNMMTDIDSLPEEAKVAMAATLEQLQIRDRSFFLVSVNGVLVEFVCCMVCS